MCARSLACLKLFGFQLEALRADAPCTTMPLAMAPAPAALAAPALAAGDGPNPCAMPARKGPTGWQRAESKSRHGMFYFFDPVLKRSIMQPALGMALAGGVGEREEEEEKKKNRHPSPAGSAWQRFESKNELGLLYYFDPSPVPGQVLLLLSFLLSCCVCVCVGVCVRKRECSYPRLGGKERGPPRSWL